MKKIISTTIAMSLLGLGGTALAQGTPMLGTGVQEVGISGNMDFNDPGGDVSLLLSGSYGYFIMDNLEVGATAAYDRQSGGDFELFELGGFGEIHFPYSNLTVPYVGASLTYSFTDNEPPVEQNIFGGDDDALVLSPRVGVKWFLREYFAIDTNIFMRWATEDIFLNDGDFEDTDWGARVGLRVYFN